MKTKTSKKFMKEAGDIHNNKYTYFNDYINSRTKIKIECPEHGIFEQVPPSHLHGAGCPKCKRNRNSTLEEFRKKAVKKHGDKYIYFKYINDSTKIKIKCPEHGIFEQRPNNHLQGNGCPKCGRSQKLTSVEFIKRAKIKHEGKYKYFNDYVNSKTKIKIECPEHGIFEQRALTHLKGHGCSKCSRNKKFTIAEFIERANKIHINKYNYSCSVYKKAQVKIEIECPEHGIFNQTPEHHILRGQGCPKCNSNISKIETCWLNSLNLPNDKNHRQVKIKLNEKHIIVDGYDPETNTIYEFWGDYWHGHPDYYNSTEMNYFGVSFGELYQKTLEKIKIIKNAGYNLIAIWEHDFKSL